MRAQARQVSHEEEEESAFISMTDMTVGFLFIMMILLAFFASRFRQDNLETVPRVRFEAEQVARKKAETEVARLQKKIEELLALQKRPLETYLSKAAETRRQLLVQLRDSLKADFPNLQVVLDEQNGALRFQGEGLFYEGTDKLYPGKEKIIRRIAERLDELLPCYTFGEEHSITRKCNPDFAVIEAVQVEGHTDSTGSYELNTRLSADRAIRTFGIMIDAVPGLRGFKNMSDQSVLSFAGYGPDRPIATNKTAEGRATNRRIDLRFIMVTPRNTEGIERIRERFEGVEK